MISHLLVRLAKSPPTQAAHRFHVRCVAGMGLVVFSVLCFCNDTSGQPLAKDSASNRPIADGNHRTSPKAAHSFANDAEVRESYRGLPMTFEPNLGQSDAEVQFLSRGLGYTLFLTHDSAVLSLEKPKVEDNAPPPGDPTRRTAPDLSTTRSVLRMQLVGANRGAAANGFNILPGKTNYLRGNDPKKWKTDISNYANVRYEDVYPGIDLIYSGEHGQLEYDFMVAPGADSHAIAMNFASADQIHVENATGDLIVTTDGSEVRFRKPVAYQIESDNNGSIESLTSTKHPVAVKYVLSPNHRVRFQLAAYNHRQPLVIDPAVSYSTYLGAAGNDFATSLAVDSAGNVYVVGYTGSTNFPVSSGAYQTSCAKGCTNNTLDGFITKFDPSGSSLIYSTYLGGGATDYINGIALDASGDAYLVGQTFSSDFPVTPGAFQTSCGTGAACSAKAFVTELNSSGSALVYSTYLGGSRKNQGNGISLDDSGDAFITGWTQSTDYPVTPGAFQTSCTCSTAPDVIVTELNPTGTALVYSTYLGGVTSADVGYAIAVNSSGNAYITGYTQSTDFPVTAGAFQTKIAANSAGFVTELSPTGSSLVYSTYLGGSSTITDVACEACSTAIAIDAAGDAYVTGLTAESNFPVTAGVFQPVLKSTSKGHNAFITELNPTGGALVFSTYLGGTQDTGGTGIAVDADGNIWLKGNTKSTDFPVTSGSFQTASGGNFDFFVSELNPGGTSLLYSTYLGGSGVEYGGGTGTLVIDSQNPPDVYVTGYTASTDFPVTPGAFQTTSGGGNDATIIKLIPSPNVGLTPSSVNFGSQLVGTTSAAQTVTLTNTGNLQLNAPTISVTGTNGADFSESDTCTGILAPQAACTVTLAFTPTLFATESANVNITDNAPNSPQSVTLNGTGIASGPAVTLSSTSLKFPTTKLRTRSAAQTVTLTNTGTDTLTVTSVVATGDFTQTNTCTTVAVGANCTITVSFFPSQINTRSGTITVTDNSSTSPQSIQLTGVGTAVQLQPPSLNFGTIANGTSSTKTNLGNVSLNISSMSIGGTNPQDFSQTNTCGTSVAKGAKCTISVTFKPTVKGLRSASLSLSDDGGASPQSEFLVGTSQ